MSVLVTYATCHGSTRSVAERIAARIADCGRRVDLLDVRDAEHVERYEAVVVGSAIHNGDWLPDGAEFLHRHALLLAARPLWLFNVGMAPAGRGRRGRWFAARTRVPHAVTADSDLLNARDLHSFAGALEPSHITPSVRPFMWMFGGRFGDFRNWPEIDAWADGIGAALAAEPIPRRPDAGRAAS